MGLMAFEAQYQQHPMPAEGAVVKRRWLKFYDAPPDCLEFTLVSWDCASALSEDADWSVETVWGVASGKFYLPEAPDLRRRIEALHADHEADRSSDSTALSGACRNFRIPIGARPKARRDRRTA
jgi:phage terminase large subunit-like protein